MKNLTIAAMASLTLFSCQKEPVIEETFDINNVPQLYELTHEATLLMSEHIGGITNDGKNLWIMYEETIGGYYDDNNIRIVNYDIDNHVEIKSFDYKNFIQPNGLAYDGNALWVNYNSSSEHSEIQKVNTSDGTIEQTFGATVSINDIDFFDNHLYMFGYNDSWNIGKLNPTSNQVSVINTDYEQSLSNRGISVRDNEMWTIDWSNQHIAVNNMQGKMIGKVKTDFLNGCDHCFSAGHHSTFLNDKFIVTKNSEIHIYSIQ